MGVPVETEGLPNNRAAQMVPFARLVQLCTTRSNLDCEPVCFPCLGRDGGVQHPETTDFEVTAVPVDVLTVAMDPQSGGTVQWQAHDQSVE